jgi:hypothetical protein
MASDFITSWASAIASFEGFNTSGSVAARNNNPGNLKYAGQSGSTGADANGFAIFPNASAGWSALYNQLQSYVNNFPGYSLLQIMAHYLGQPTPTTDSQGNAYTYAGYVSSSLGVDSGTTLAELASNSALPADGSAGDLSDLSDGSDVDLSQSAGINPLWWVGGAVLGGALLVWALED